MTHAQYHIVLCCIPCYGHAKPLLLLAEDLADAGHEVTYATSQAMAPYFADMCRHPRVNMLPLDDGLVPEIEDFMLGKPKHVKLCVPFYAEDKMTPPLVGAVKKLPRRPDLMISDHLTFAGGNAARACGIKHACHVTWPLFMLEKAGVLPVHPLAHFSRVCVRAVRSSRFSPQFIKPTGPPFALLKRVSQHCLGGEKGSGGLVLVTSSFGIEPPRPLPPCVKVIGRGQRREAVEALDEYPELKAFLDGHDQVVFVTFGSRVLPPANLVRSVAQGLLIGGWAVAWTLKQAQQSYLPEAVKISTLFFVRSWLPQGPALAHPNIKAAITHCGMGGLHECAANAIPVVPLPFSLSADQPVNARTAEVAGFAARPRPMPGRWWKLFSPGNDPEFTPNAIREAVHRAMQDPMLLEGAKRARRAVLASGYGRGAVDAVESACLYGTDNLTGNATKQGRTSRSSQILKQAAACAAVGVIVAAVIKMTALTACCRGHGGKDRLGLSCRVL